MDINTGKSLSKRESLNQSINLILLTSKNERVLNRNFGSNVSNYLDQPLNSVAIDISAEVISSLQSNDSRILVDGVNTQLDANSNFLVTINYNTQEATNVKFT